MNIVEFAFGVALCALPTAFCVLIWRRSPLVRSVGRVLVAIGCISLVGCSDIGSWLIGKQGGRWRVYVRENGEIRCVDNEILPDETKGTQRCREERLVRILGKQLNRICSRSRKMCIVLTFGFVKTCKISLLTLANP